MVRRGRAAAISARAGYDWLHQLGDHILTANPVRRGPARCAYLAPAPEAYCGAESRAAARAWYEDRFGLRVVALEAYPTPAAYEAAIGCERAAVDAYHCHGGVSHGSGRAVLSEGYQIKGVGRTSAASFQPFYKDVCGAQGLYEAFREAYASAVLDVVLASGVMPIDFILLPEERGIQVTPLRPDLLGAGEPRGLLGRRGSPFRPTHLEYLRGKLLRFGAAAQEGLWGGILAQLAATAGQCAERSTRDRLRGLARTWLGRALRLCAESRTFSLRLAYWGDNYDLFGRVFDCASMRTTFPRLALETETAAAWETDDPARTLSFVRLGGELPMDRSLLPVQNVVNVVRLLAGAVGADGAAIDDLLAWPALVHGYRRALTQTAGRVLGFLQLDGVPVRFADLEVRRLALMLEAAMPLVRCTALPPAGAAETNLLDATARAVGWGRGWAARVGLGSMAGLAAYADPASHRALRARIDRDVVAAFATAEGPPAPLDDSVFAGVAASDLACGGAPRQPRAG